MNAYHYDSITKKFDGILECQIDPLESKIKNESVYLVPGNSTLEKPPDSKDGYDIIWDNNKWAYQQIVTNDNQDIEQISDEQQEYYDLMSKLNSTDYIPLKIIENDCTADDYKDILEQRKQWRKRVSELKEILEVK